MGLSHSEFPEVKHKFVQRYTNLGERLQHFIILKMGKEQKIIRNPWVPTPSLFIQLLIQYIY